MVLIKLFYRGAHVLQVSLAIVAHHSSRSVLFEGAKETALVVSLGRLYLIGVQIFLLELLNQHPDLLLKQLIFLLQIIVVHGF